MRLVPLRIPAGWTVVTNAFVDIEDPGALTKDEQAAYLAQDLLQLRAGNLILDVGWTPDGDPAGRYRLELVEAGWARTFVRLEHRSAGFIREAIDLCLAELARDADPESLEQLLVP